MRRKRKSHGFMQDMFCNFICNIAIVLTYTYLVIKKLFDCIVSSVSTRHLLPPTAGINNTTPVVNVNGQVNAATVWDTCTDTCTEYCIEIDIDGQMF